ncbi:hypothetical protein NIES4101_89750 [Calothrix sp. NIES-4101]|nr:hypothetical protein NIES4101_89750 [Calothrix sp. NIES-4101]
MAQDFVIIGTIYKIYINQQVVYKVSFLILDFGGQIIRKSKKYLKFLLIFITKS